VCCLFPRIFILRTLRIHVISIFQVDVILVFSKGMLSDIEQIHYADNCWHQKAPKKTFISHPKSKTVRTQKNTKYFRISFNHHPTKHYFSVKATEGISVPSNLTVPTHTHKKKIIIIIRKKKQTLSFRCLIGPHEISPKSMG